MVIHPQDVRISGMKQQVDWESLTFINQIFSRWDIYPLVNCHIAIEHGNRNSGFSH